MDVLVLGQGAVGRSVANRLATVGHDIRVCDRKGWQKAMRRRSDVLVLALTHGKQSAEVIAMAGCHGAVVDLTTQSPASAARCQAAAERLGVSYSGGGINGGARALGRGDAMLLLGPPPTSAGRGIADALGGVLPFAQASAAAAAKLLHNAYLLCHQYILAAALGAAAQHGVDGLTQVLVTGTAGRPLDQCSLLRDSAGEPSSSYLSRLAAKDLRLISAAFPGFVIDCAGLLDRMIQVLSSEPERPFTAEFLRAVAVARGDQSNTWRLPEAGDPYDN